MNRFLISDIRRVRWLQICPHRLFKLPALAVFGLGLLHAHAAELVKEPAGRKIRIDYLAVGETNNHFEAMCVGAGRLGELLRKAAVDQLPDVHSNCGFQYLRCHGLFSDEMAVYSENRGAPNYNFQHIDLAYDAILDAGMKPFVELGFMPSALASTNKTVFWWKANVSAPKNYDKWGKLVHELTLHLEQRYGREEIKTWYFEVWNEPNLPSFFTGTMEDYFKLYDVSARAVKSVCEDYKVGGPATAGNAWIKEFIQHCRGLNVPLDFISTHTYGTHSVLDEFGNKIQYLTVGADAVSSAVGKVNQEIRQSAMPRLNLYYTEWNTSPSSRDPVHDSYISAAYILNSLKRSAGLANAMSYWTFTDVFEEAGPAPSPFHGGFGLLNLQGLHKPSYFAYQFLHELGNQELKCTDPSATACRGVDGVQLLFWNFTQPNQSEPDNVFFKRDLMPKRLPPVEVTIENIPAGKYALQVFGVGYRRNDVFADFTDLGSPVNPTREQVAQLASKNNGTPLASEKVEIKAGQIFTRHLEMRENDVYLLKLIRH